MNFVAEIIGLKFALETQLGNIVVFERSKQRVKMFTRKERAKKLFSNDRFFVTVRQNIISVKSSPQVFRPSKVLLACWMRTLLGPSVESATSRLNGSSFLLLVGIIHLMRYNMQLKKKKQRGKIIAEP